MADDNRGYDPFGDAPFNPEESGNTNPQNQGNTNPQNQDYTGQSGYGQGGYSQGGYSQSGQNQGGYSQGGYGQGSYTEGPGYQGYNPGYAAGAGYPQGGMNQTMNPGEGVKQPGGDQPPQIPVMSGETPFSITESIGVGFKRMNANVGTWLGITLVFIAVILLLVGAMVATIFATMPMDPATDTPAMSPTGEDIGVMMSSISIFYLLLFVFSFFINIFFYRGAFEEVDGRPASFKSFFKVNRWGSLIGVYILTGVVSFVGMLPGLALIAIGGIMMGENGSTPGVILLILGYVIMIALAIVISTITTFMPLLVMDGRSSVMGSPAVAWKIVKPKFFQVLIALILISIVSGIGALALYIGLIYTVPIGLIATVHLYRQLIGGRRPVPMP
ncbi:hypothetical protein [Corynebacterium sp. H113]|uniref:hypothetical protein n=1 Tax=Corynebacterium sp. H113 TaxID=3133419 RepID=UPI0030AE604C